MNSMSAFERENSTSKSPHAFELEGENAAIRNDFELERKDPDIHNVFELQSPKEIIDSSSPSANSEYFSKAPLKPLSGEQILPDDPSKSVFYNTLIDELTMNHKFHTNHNEGDRHSNASQFECELNQSGDFLIGSGNKTSQPFMDDSKSKEHGLPSPNYSKILPSVHPIFQEACYLHPYFYHCSTVTQQPVVNDFRTTYPKKETFDAPDTLIGNPDHSYSYTAPNFHLPNLSVPQESNNPIPTFHPLNISSHCTSNTQSSVQNLENSFHSFNQNMKTEESSEQISNINSKLKRKRSKCNSDIVVNYVQMRKMKNREAAAKSRARKQAFFDQLQSELIRLSEENENLREKYNALQNFCNSNVCKNTIEGKQNNKFRAFTRCVTW